jgi:hypothetical protein
MKALALIPDSSAEVISGGFFNTTFSSSSSGSGNIKQIVNQGAGLVGIGSLRFKFGL